MDLHDLELFALADDRAKALEQLVPGTDDYYFHQCLVHEQAGDLAAVERTLTAWIDRLGHTGRVTEVRHRLALLRYGSDPEWSCRYLQSVLDLRFDHERVVPGQKPEHPTVLDPVLVARDAVRSLGLAHSREGDLSGFTDAALPWLSAEPMEAERLRHLLGRLRRPDVRHLPKLLLQELSDRRSGGFGSLAIHRLLLKDQLDELVERSPQLLTVDAFVQAYLAKLHPGPDVDWEHDFEAHRELLDRLWAFVEPLAPKFGALEAHVLYHRLELDRQQGTYDRAQLLRYLQLPRQVSYANPTYLRRFSSGPVRPFRIDQDFHCITLHPVVHDDEPLVRDYLEHLLRDQDDLGEFSDYLRTSFLQEVFATTKILAGLGDIERWTSMLGDPSRFAQLKDRVTLEFSAENRRYYRVDEPVTLHVDVKNVPVLTVKVFEINTLNYHLVRGGEVGTGVDLDGLVASEEQVHELAEPPLRRVRRTFELPALSGAGVWVVELLGGGISSRALVCKGRLRYVERIGVAGHVFTIVDEDGALRPRATLWLGGREYSPDEHGEITVPFSTRPGRSTILLCDGDLTTVEVFRHQAERYSLNAGFYVDRESLLAGREATVMVRPRLQVSGVPASCAVVEQPRLVVRSTDHEGVESTMEVSDFTLHDDRESSHTFKVPERLASIAFTLRGRVENLSAGRTLDLEDTRTFECNAIDREDATYDLHLAHTAAGYVLYLYGRTGEPRPDVPVHLRLRHRELVPTIDVMLQTDARGRVQLGHLRDVGAIEASTPSGRSRPWVLPRDRSTRPRMIHARAGETVRIPLMDVVPLGAVDVRDEHGLEAPRVLPLQRSEVSLLQRIGNTYLEDRFDAVRHEDGILEIEGLPAGDYELCLPRESVTITLRIGPGDDVGGWVFGPTRMLERGVLQTPQIRAVTPGEQAVEIRLDAAPPGTRVHVFGTRFVPGHAPPSTPAVPPRMLRPSRRHSHYISGRDIGDEYRYILERRRAQKFAGTMLARPGLLLAPWAVRGTETGTAVAAAGGAYANSAPPRPSAAAAPASPPPPPEAAGAAASSNLDFLAHPAAALLNLEPDADGVVCVPVDAVEHANCLRIVAVAPGGVVHRDVLRSEVTTPHQDLRLRRALAATGSFARQRVVSLRPAGQTLRIADITTSKIELYDTLARAYRLMVSRSGDATLERFGFILRWPQLPEDDKRARYSEFCCHELNLWLSRKDRDFFTQVVVPHLRNKKHPTFIDHYLLEHDLSGYLQPWAYGRLNVVERILLAQRIDGQCEPCARHVGDLDDLRPPDAQLADRLFQAAIGGAALETEDVLGYGSAAASLEMADEEFDGLALDDDDDAEDESMLRSLGVPSAPPPPGGAPGASRGGVKRKRAARSRAMVEAPAQAASFGGGGPGIGGRQDLARREQQRRHYRALDTTQELAENDYYQLPVEQQGPELITANPFWRDFAEHRGPGPFLSRHVAYACGNFAEMMCALAVLDLPLSAEAPQVVYDGAVMTMDGGSASIAYHEQIAEAEPAADPAPILVSQSYLRHDDRYRYEGGEAHDKYVTGELLVGVVYTCKIVLTNPTSATQSLELLMQIPAGSLPVSGGLPTLGRPIQLLAQSTESIEYSFYFPAPGTFGHFPVHVTLDGKRVAAAEPRSLEVVREPSEVDHDAWAWVSQNASDDDVLAWLGAHNLERLQQDPGGQGLDAIAWRLKEREFYDRCLALLSLRHVYHHGSWSYAIHHRDTANIGHFLRHDDLLDACGDALECPLVTIDPVARHRYQHLEYAPLVNARAHRLGARHEILNRRFAEQYQRLMSVLRYRPALRDDDRLSVACYLLLQDRREEGLQMFDRVDPAGVHTTLQYDFVQVYALMLREQPQRAREVAERYRDYPVDRWRKLFGAALAQLDELDGAAAKVVDPEDRDEQQTALADTEPDFDLTVEDGRVTVTYQNLAAVKVAYYRMDLELLFSRQPFVQQLSDRFSLIKPGLSDQVALPAERDTFTFEFPEPLRGANVVVELSAHGRRRQQVYFAHALVVQVIETYGQLRVTQRGTSQPLPRTYVKVYARMQGGEVQFYKDGYTDLRGRFDYTSLSTNALDHVERFSILVMNPEHGSLIREAAPPQR